MKLNFAFSDCTNPYTNLAIEWSLLINSKPGSITLFLWQNDNTVVIGANQNPYLECNLEKLYASGGKIARRRTGGGAVYHDLGNLNFSFIVSAKDYDVNKQLSVIQKALLSFGIISELSGRNDITANGKKFSGNAFYNTKTYNLHHGTILIKTDSGKLKDFLCPSKEKLLAKGVKSVESRIINLSEICPMLTADTLIVPLKNAFESVYEEKSENLDININSRDIVSLAEKWESEEYIFGKWKNFVSNIKGSFSWGLVDIELKIEGGIITEALIASDSLFPNSIQLAEDMLRNVRLSDVENISSEDKIAHDIINLLRK